MKKLIFLLTCFFIIEFAAHQLCAQSPSASATAKATATIVAPIKIAKTTDLSFGNIIAGSSSGTVKIETDNSRTHSGDVTLPTSSQGTITAARFTVSGLPNASYSIAVPASIIITREGGTEMMLVDNITTTPATSGTLSENGEQIINVGATLHVDANQEEGVYTNESGMTVTVAYQ
ncbi:DUF4402 domain-containing protein [Anaerorudis cellulosivorans]|uniref:DUF4402 domain-containing protein n=1 Tax=Anaerorudis cellulosivorans TaxID=3397862 RepID=UPI00221FFB26|nr:DUF4402 domain-containing protein [Seramator thermalis]MCW1735316.1 DUF4402 domain-containing protein [Seramator thermalis]